MRLEHYTAIMVTLNVVIAVIALWQRHQSASEARRRRLKRIRKQQEKNHRRLADARQ